jgi:hypothetical protein
MREICRSWSLSRSSREKKPLEERQVIGKGKGEMDQNPAQRLTAREALKRVLVSRYENTDINPTVLAA